MPCAQGSQPQGHTAAGARALALGGEGWAVPGPTVRCHTTSRAWAGSPSQHGPLEVLRVWHMYS